MQIPIDRLCSKKLITINESDSLAEADFLMEKHNIRHLPVTNRDGILVGLLSKADFIALKNVTATLAELEVKKYMSSPVKVMASTSKVKDAAAIMIRYKISSLLISKDNDVIGILTSEDLLRLIAENSSFFEEHELIDLDALAEGGWISMVTERTA